MKSLPSTQRYFSLESLAAYRTYAAWLVLEHGPEFVPVLERVEREYAEALAGDPVMRAKRILEVSTDEVQMRDGAVKAILLSHSAF